jgi:chromosome segregation ATPase
MPNEPQRYVTLEQFQKLVDYADSLNKQMTSIKRQLASIDKENKKNDAKFKALTASVTKHQTKIVNIAGACASMSTAITNAISNLRDFSGRLRDLESRLR